MMSSLKFDLTDKTHRFKVLNAVNGGPLHRSHSADDKRSNFEDYKALRIPYNRTHDANHHGIYGGPYAYDISVVFPNFDADPYDPASYDFACTDEAVKVSMEAGTKVFYRLGESIEHTIVKHVAHPPMDFKKWAVICEHIIRHYTEGWANGFEYDMKYWEIWNEPDLREEKPNDRPNWTGTRSQFFDLYEITAKHLKQCFPHLKIGGPAVSSRMYWMEDFLYVMRQRNVPIDFISWHSYCKEPKRMLEKSATVTELLHKYQYDNAERILNEWNYIRGWKDEDFTYSLKAIHGMKEASFIMACMCAVQNTDYVDMLMYYDFMPSIWNGAFDYYTFKRLKAYYTFLWCGMFQDMKYAINAENNVDNLYSLCGVNEEGKSLTVITYYSDDDTLENQQISIDFGREGKYEIYLLDEEHDGDFVKVTDNLEFDIKLHSLILIKEI